MEVFGFQLFFFITILISAIFGRKTRNSVVLFSIIFTVIMVFMTWLIILQFFTIAIAYYITENYVDGSQNKLNDVDNKYGKGCIVIIVIVGILAISSKIFSDNYKKNHPLKTEQEEIIKKNYNNSNNIPSSYNDENNFDIDNSISDTILSKFDKKQDANNLQISLISDFISAENSRDLPQMNQYLASMMIRFWNLELPSIKEVDKEYYKTWTKYNYTNTEIIEVNNFEYNLYKVKVIFNYDSKYRESEMIFGFDENNKIIAIY
ncbi:MAG: hypothetical protein DI529_15470 [Chryseobacterium sp.]|nr:MAG: hypothetical protein DI529_15470 [Chryseobacterium sp.]